MKKRNYKCKVDGVVGRVGKYVGICPKSVVNGYCGAHGNAKCEHKVKIVNAPTDGDRGSE